MELPIISHTNEKEELLRHSPRNAWGELTLPIQEEFNIAGIENSLLYTNYSYDSVLDNYFAQARFYDAKQGRMLSKDPVKRGLNPYPYCKNSPKNYVDPTGEVANILVGGALGGVIGGAFGYVGSAISQKMNGERFDSKKAWGAAANGAVVGAVRGALVGSGVGMLGSLGANFGAGALGSALEQKIGTGKVDFRESVTNGLINGVSGAIYGNDKLKSLGSAFLRGAGAGAATAAINNLSDALMPRQTKRSGSQRNGSGNSYTGGNGRSPYTRRRDPRACGASSAFQGGLGYRNTYGYQYQTPKTKGKKSEKFSLGGFAKDVLLGAVMGGLSSALFYGAGKGVEKLKGNLKRNVKSGSPAVPGTSKLIGAGEGEQFGVYASKATHIEGYADVIVHGAPPNQVGVMHNGKWAYLNQRSLSNYLKQDAGYTGGSIRLLSCGTGSTPNGFAQNLANKMGVQVMAPSDTIWAFPNGKLTIGPKSFSNTGQWNVFNPGNH